MNKCEWKDGQFEPCHSLGKQGMQWDHNGIDWIEGIDIEINYCPFCGADMHKPEEKLLIVKSGDAWALDDELGSLIYTNPKQTNRYNALQEYIAEKRTLHNPNFKSYWKSFTGPNPDITELTDEIAKLRPMVTCADDTDFICKLYGIEDDIKITLNRHNSWVPWNTCRLATAHELQEAT